MNAVSLAAGFSALLAAVVLRADPPSASYIYPAGGQRGTIVEFRVGGHFLHEACAFEMHGPGIAAPPRIELTRTLWFEGPVIPIPASQQAENYPQDYAGRMTIAAVAPLGLRTWRVSTSQGAAPRRTFVVGDFPEVVEEEIEGDPIPVRVTLPVTVNGRIFPREDVDVWTFAARAGDVVTCDVAAARLGSPLDARLEVRGPDGSPLAESIDGVGVDPRLRFTAPADGLYEVRIHDVRFGGLQDHVYRLTITAGPVLDRVFPLGGRGGEAVELELSGTGLPAAVEVTLPDDGRGFHHFRPDVPGMFGSALLELDDLPEYVRRTLDDALQAVRLPAVLNGRIWAPGHIDRWTFEAAEGESLSFDLKAARLGSPLDSVLTLFDADGRQVATADDMGDGQTDSQLAVTIPAAGTYTLTVSDRLASRGGREYAYRLRAIRPGGPAVRTNGEAFRLRLPTDVVVLERGKESRLRIDLERIGGFQEEVEILCENLPSGVTAGAVKIPQGQAHADLVLTAADDARPGNVPLRLLGKAVIEQTETVDGGPAVTDRREVVGRAVVAVAPGEPQAEGVLLSVAVATPFRFVGEFETKYGARGTVFVRRYALERNGFEGPVEIRLADRQARHLQGVTGPTIVVPPGRTHFEYPVALAPWMEVGRTSRTCLMAVGEVQLEDSSRHKVCYSSQEQNDQIIVLVDPGRLSVTPRQRSLLVEPGGDVELRVDVARGTGIEGPVTVELVLPDHVRGAAAEPITIAPGRTTGRLLLRFDEGRLGPFNAPASVRAAAVDERGLPVIDEARVTLVHDLSE